MALDTGTRIGLYEVTGHLGSGGMGEVWRAHDTKLDRDVTIKTLPRTLVDDAERLTRFDREAKLLATLNHANIAAIYSLDELEGTHYLVMELIEGETLEERLESGALPVEYALLIALPIALALEAAHEQRVVHRGIDGRAGGDRRRFHGRRAGQAVRERFCRAAADGGCIRHIA